MPTVTTAQARAIIDAAFEGAARRKVSRMSVAVADAGGMLIAAQRSDAGTPVTMVFAQAKIRTALNFRRATIKLSGFAEDAAVAATMAGVLSGGFVPMGGGVPIVDAQGDIIGAAGFSGAAAEVDHDIIAEAVRSAGLAIPG